VADLYGDQAFDVELRAVTKRFGSLTAVNALAVITLGVTVLAVTITAVVLRRSRVQAAPRQEQASGQEAALGLR
jgi:hypothetical protein